MKFLVYGAGAIGGYLGGMLALGGHTVAFIARPAQADALNTRGLTVHNTHSVIRNTRNIRAFPSSSEALAQSPYDCLLLALKSFDTDTAIADLQAAGAAAPPIVCLQNGVDNEPKLREAFGPENVIAGTVLTAVAAPEPGVIVIEKSRGAGLGGGHPLSDRLASALSSADVYTKVYPDAEAMKWTKLLTNLMGNAASAICDVTTEVVFTHSGLYEIEVRALKEALAVMQTKGLAVAALPRSPTRQLAFALQYLPPRWYQPVFRRTLGGARGDKKPSLHIDLLARKTRSEVAFLNGAVARHAEALGLNAPVNRALTEILEGIVAGRMAWEEYQGKPDKLAKEILGADRHR